MKVFNAGQIRKWDASTMQNENISQTALMQRAGAACARVLKKKFNRSVFFYIACGKGGNGGDGLVIARALRHAGYNIAILLINSPATFQGATLDHWTALQRDFPETANLATLASDVIKGPRIPEDMNSKSIVIIDALLGTGFTPGRENTTINQVIKMLNSSGSPIIAIDLPSGLSTDELPAVGDSAPTIVRATYTLTFQAYKRSFLHPETGPYTGKIRVLNIGLNEAFVNTENTSVYATDLKAAAQLYRPRSAYSFGHKGNFGTIVLVGGSYGKIGAISLCARAALRGGAGKVFIQAPKCGYEILQTAIPEAMFEPAGESYVSQIDPVNKSVFGIGPGMDTHPESGSALKTFLEGWEAPLVLDADALNIIAMRPDIFFPLIPANSILTPHPGEFSRLFGATENSLEQVKKASYYAGQLHIIIVLKGHRTAVCTPDGNIYYNLSGNAGMATAGSGDVLTGVITSLLGQGYTPDDAAILGVYLHGLAGDCYIRKSAQESLIAHDLTDSLPKAYKMLKKSISGKH